MALTAALRTLLITLIATGLNALVMALNLTDQIDVQSIAELVANVIVIVGSAAVAFFVNKLGSKYPWVNTLISFGRAKSPAVYIPSDASEVTAVATPPGEKTTVTATHESGSVAPVPV